MSFYNSLVEMTRNKELYKNFKSQDEFSDRLVFFLIHLAFFFKVYKNDENTKVLQDIYDFIFRQIDLSLRESGDGDVSVNKKMKNYINTFHSILIDIINWDHKIIDEKNNLLKKYLYYDTNSNILASYFDKYLIYLKNNNLNFFTESVNKHKF